MSSPQAPPGREGALHDLPGLLAIEGVEILDVRRGVARGTRRLVAGRSGDAAPTHVIALATDACAGPALEREERHVLELHQRLRPGMRSTLPAVLEAIEASGQPGLAMTAVPGLGRSTPIRSHRRLAGDTTALLQWLRQLWTDTGSLATACTLGADALAELMTRYSGIAGLAGTMGAVHRARARLGSVIVPRTAVHGCLCNEHVFVADGAVMGVEDWSGSDLRSEPLRDLAGWVVRAVGNSLVDVVTVRNTSARSMRDFLVQGLATWDVPATRWRDVLVLAQAEVAVDRLRAGDSSCLDLLTTISRALPRERTSDGRHP